ncbi:cation:proton antiporter [Candidatus Uhrbacteria bacterium]|nr:cation:proton antiporter [Candidatus Uhrbacteria bacterium]
MEELFFEIGSILILAAILAMVIFRLRQPLILAYIITGAIVGSSLLALTQSQDIFSVMSKIGVAFLLFTVGLGLNWRSFKDVSGIALATGVGQVLLSTILGFIVALFLGFDIVSSIYLSVAFAFSSTIIIVKLLMDKEEIDTLYGRISVGFLIVQDFIAILILLGLSAVSGGKTIEQVFIGIIIKAFVLSVVLWMIATRVIPKLLSYVAKSQELLLLFSIAWCFLVAGILVFFGFTMEVGALIAGISLSGSLYQREINARIRPLRDFFLMIFFIVLGTQLRFDQAITMLIPILVFSAFILIGKPVIVIAIMRLLGYHPRTGFLSGTAVAQISEFSFILLAAGMASGHISETLLPFATAVALITIAVSVFFIEHNDPFFDRLRPMFRWLEPRRTLESEKKRKVPVVPVLLFGYHPIGSVILDSVRALHQPYLIVDFDPEVIRSLSKIGEPHIYGDVSDESFLDELEADHAKMIISTIPDAVVSSDLLTFLKNKKFRGISVVTVHIKEEAQLCYELGASYVIIPNALSGKKFAEILKSNRIQKKAWLLDRKPFIE